MLAVTQEQHIIMATVVTRSMCEAEAAAIAMAIADAERRNESAVILSDSQTACCLFINGTVPKMVRRILGQTLKGHHDIIWCPAHKGLEGNVAADRIARGLNNRVAARPSAELLLSTRYILQQL